MVIDPRYPPNCAIFRRLATTPSAADELRGGRGAIAARKQASRAAIALGVAPIASRYADYRQKPRLGLRGEDFPLVNRLPALPASAQ
jgi:hypothetical protein